MTPEQLELAEAFEQVTFRAGDDKRFADAFIATAKKNPGVAMKESQSLFVQDLARRYRRQLPVGLVIGQAKQGAATMAWIAADLTKHAKKCASHTGAPCNCNDVMIKDEPWVAGNAAKAIALFPNKSLHQVAAFLTILHPFAYDYIAAAPVIVLAAAQGTSLTKSNDRKRIAREWVSRFESGGKLRKMMDAAGVAYPLRKLHPSVLKYDHWETVQVLCEFDRESKADLTARQGGSVLNDLIPEREDQKEWLDSIQSWHTQVGRRFGNRLLHFEWVARQFNPANMRRLNINVREATNQAGNLADYAGNQGDRFNTTLNLAQMLNAQREWHDQLARTQNDQRFMIQHGRMWDEPIDYTPFPLCFQILPYEFTALRSGKDLHDEGQSMHHCVGSYSQDVISGRARIYHIHDIEIDRKIGTVEFCYGATGQGLGYVHRAIIDGDTAVSSMATMNHYEIDNVRYGSHWYMAQAKGPTNGRLGGDVNAAIEKFKERLNLYWAMYQHEKKQLEGFENRLLKKMLETPKLIIHPREFPDLRPDMREAVEQIYRERTAPKTPNTLDPGAAATWIT